MNPDGWWNMAAHTVFRAALNGGDVIAALAASEGRSFEPTEEQMAVLRSAASFMARVIARPDARDGHGAVGRARSGRARRWADRLGGSGKGAEVLVSLPSELSVPGTEAPTAVAGPPSEGRTVLIIDDEPGVREITRLYLEQAGFVVWESATGKDGLDLLAGAPGRVALTLLDNHLPDAPGCEIAERIQALAQPMPIIVESGDASGAASAKWPAGPRT